MRKNFVFSVILSVLPLLTEAQLTHNDVVILFDGTTYGTNPGQFIYEAHASNNFYTKEMVGHTIKWTLNMGTPGNFDALGIFTFPSPINLKEHTKIVAKIKLSQYDKGFGIELRGKSAESVASEVDWLDTVIAGQTVIWTNGNYAGSDTKVDAIIAAGNDWQYFEYEILRWYCSYPAHAKIDSTQITQLTPYYGYKSTVPLESDEVIIDYIVMVPAGTTTTDVNKYMAIVDDGIAPVTEVDANTIKISAYPNPVSFLLNLTQTNDVANWSVTNLLGVTMKNNTHDGAESIQINVDDLPAGTYVYKLITKQGNVVSGKFMVER